MSRTISTATVFDEDILFGFDSNPEGHVDSLFYYINVYLPQLLSESFVVWTTLVIKKDGTLLYETNHYSGIFDTVTNIITERLPDNLVCEIKSTLIKNEEILREAFESSSWMRWPVIVSYNGETHILDKSQYDDMNKLKAVIQEIVNLIASTGAKVALRDFWIRY